MTHQCTLLHDGLRHTFKKSSFRPVRIVAVLGEKIENDIRSLESCVWLVGVERYSSTTNDLVRRVVTTSPGVKAVILAAYRRPDDALTALKAGACGFLRQDIPGERLIKSLELIAHSQMVIYPQLPATTANGKKTVPQRQIPATPNCLDIWIGHPRQLRRRRDRVRKSRERCKPRPNSPRDADPANADGGRFKQSYRTQVSDDKSTVKVHMKAILRKLRLQNRTQAAVWARDHSSELGCCTGESLGRTRFGPTSEPRLRAGPPV